MIGLPGVLELPEVIGLPEVLELPEVIGLPGVLELPEVLELAPVTAELVEVPSWVTAGPTKLAEVTRGVIMLAGEVITLAGVMDGPTERRRPSVRRRHRPTAVPTTSTATTTTRPTKCMGQLCHAIQLHGQASDGTHAHRQTLARAEMSCAQIQPATTRSGWSS